MSEDSTLPPESMPPSEDSTPAPEQMPLSPESESEAAIKTEVEFETETEAAIKTEEAIEAETDIQTEAETEWTDDTDSPLPESDPVIPAASDTSEDQWQEDTLDWEDDPIDVASPPPRAASTGEALAWLTPVWQRGWTLWKRILVGVKTRIPAAAKLSDGVLSGILMGSLVLLLTVFNSVRQPAVTAEVPPSGPPLEAEPIAEPTPPSLDRPAEDTNPEPQPTPVELDPAERDRMAELQTQLTSGSLSDGNGLVESVQADFQHNQLTINVSNGWYRLSGHEQEELAATFKQRSIEMTFDDVQLRSPDGDLVARSPVIGKDMVILQREQPPEVEPPPRPRYRVTIDR